MQFYTILKHYNTKINEGSKSTTPHKTTTLSIFLFQEHPYLIFQVMPTLD